MHEICHGLDSEIDPLAKGQVREVPDLHIFLRIQTCLFFERGYRVVVEAGPGAFPAFKVRHPVRNIHIDAINSCCSNLPHPFHINLAPFLCVRSDPYVLVPLLDPEGSSFSKNCRLSGDLALQPIRMLFGQRMCSLIRVCGDAFGASDVNKGAVARLVSFLSYSPDCLQFFLGMEKAFVASRDVIVHFNSEHVAVPGVTNNSIWFISSKAIRSDAHVVRPILSKGKTLGEHSNDTCAKNQRNERDDGFLHSVSWESRNLQNSN